MEVVKSWSAVWLESLGLVALFGSCVWGVRNRRPWSLPALMIFAVLAPSSSFIPLTGEVLAEHRLVLPLAAGIPLALAFFWTHLPQKKVALPLGLSLALAAGLLTYQRNEDYRSEESIWRDTVEKRPNNARALNNLFKPLIGRGELAEAELFLRRSLELRPGSVRAWNNLGVLMIAKQEWQAAESAFARSLEIRPRHAKTHYNLGQYYASKSRWAEARASYEVVSLETPEAARGHIGLGQALLHLKQRGAAIVALERGLALKPQAFGAMRNLAWILSTAPEDNLRDGPRALQWAQRLCAGTPAPGPQLEEVLAVALAANGRFDEALTVSERAAQSAQAGGFPQVARQIRRRARLFARGEPYRE